MHNAELIKAQAPSVFTMTRHPTRTSDRYIHIPTPDVLDMFEREGWITVKAAQARSRGEDGRAYDTHTLRLRHVSSLLDGALKVNDTFPEIVWRNSHNGGRTAQMLSGLFRLACSNGMVVSMGDVMAKRFRHSGDNVMEAVLENGVWVVKQAQSAQNASKKMSTIMMSKAQQLTFVHQISEAIAGDKMRFPLEQLLAVRRDEDAKDTLWNVFNRAQENVMRGGMNLTSENGRPSRSRAIVNADRDIKINAAMWAVAEKWAA